MEWKFSRSKLFMEFIQGGATLPVPFNIIPTPKSAFYLSKKSINALLGFFSRTPKQSESKKKDQDKQTGKSRLANDSLAIPVDNEHRQVKPIVSPFFFSYCSEMDSIKYRFGIIYVYMRIVIGQTLFFFVLA
jgi:hypothetical protein